MKLDFISEKKKVNFLYRVRPSRIKVTGESFDYSKKISKIMRGRQTITFIRLMTPFPTDHNSFIPREQNQNFSRVH